MLKNVKVCVRPPAHARLAKSYVILFVLVPAKAKTSFFTCQSAVIFCSSIMYFFSFSIYIITKNFLKIK